MENHGETATKEVWRRIEFARGGYKVSSLGRVCNPKGHILASGDNGGGYRYLFYITPEGKPVRAYVHRLVASYFIPNPEGYPYVNHKNLDKSDNRVENLEWVSAKQNTKHGIDAGKINQKGRGWTKHPDETIREMYKLNLAGMSLCEIERVHGVKRTTMASIINGKSRKGLLDDLTP